MSIQSDITALLRKLEKDQEELDDLMVETPTGAPRDDMAEANILLLDAIRILRSLT